MGNRSVGALFVAARDGDSDAWNELVERLAPGVWNAAWRTGLSRDLALEVFQITWLRLLENRDRIQDPDRIAGWVTTTARNEAIKLNKASMRTSARDPSELPSGHTDGPEHAVVHAAQRDLMLQGFERLNDRCRALLRLLVAVPKVPYEQIAERLDMAIGSIGPTRERCLAKLRATPAIVELLG